MASIRNLLLSLTIFAGTGFTVVTPDATCGSANGYTCPGSQWGNCCGRYGWCGSTDVYCGAGCQPAYGFCGSNDQPPVLVSRQYPHQLIHLSSASPNTAFGTFFYGSVLRSADGSSQRWNEILFDVPNNDATTCRINFTVPPGSNGAGPNWSASGNPPAMDVSEINGIPDPSTDTWNSHPPFGNRVGTIRIASNGAVALSPSTGIIVPCRKGQAQSFLLSSLANGINVTWYELDNPITGITYEMWR